MKQIRTTTPKTDQFVMRLTEEDRGKLTTLATAADQSAADVVRSLIRREYDKHAAKAARR